ncbi:MAG: hypothetical protein Q4F75_09615, partial [Pseudomonadota bacterium]|nr:hypothetical protein [Pseudomonadota bacterium]
GAATEWLGAVFGQGNGWRRADDGDGVTGDGQGNGEPGRRRPAGRVKRSEERTRRCKKEKGENNVRKIIRGEDADFGQPAGSARQIH